MSRAPKATELDVLVSRLDVKISVLMSLSPSIRSRNKAVAGVLDLAEQVIAKYQEERAYGSLAQDSSQ